MTPSSAVLALALLTTSSLALPFNFPFWSHPDQGSWHPEGHPNGPPQGRPHSGPPNGYPGEDHPLHYSVVGPGGHPTEPTSLPASTGMTSRPHATGTGLPYSYPTSSSFPTPTSYPFATGAILPTGTGFLYPTGTGFPFPTGTGFPFPTGTGLPFPLPIPYYGPPYGLIPPPGNAPNRKRFEGPRRQHAGPQQQQWQPYHGPWGEGEQHGHPHGPPHGSQPLMPTAGSVASTGFATPTGAFPTGGFATGGIPVPTGYAWPTGTPEWEGEGFHGPPSWSGHGGRGFGGRE